MCVTEAVLASASKYVGNLTQNWRFHHYLLPLMPVEGQVKLFSLHNTGVLQGKGI